MTISTFGNRSGPKGILSALPRSYSTGVNYKSKFVSNLLQTRMEPYNTCYKFMKINTNLLALSEKTMKYKDGPNKKR